MDVDAQKRAIRAEMKAKRAALSHEEIRLAARIGVDALFNPRQMNLFSRFRGFASYMSVGEEFPTDYINQEIFRLGMPLVIPHYQPQKEAYAWATLLPGEPLMLGYHAIPEPVHPRPADPAEVDVALVPGLAFDVCGGRIGYGAGVYDRLLLRLRPSTIKVALAYDFQVHKEVLPQATHDLKVDYIVTEKQWIDCRLAHRLRRERNG